MEKIEDEDKLFLELMEDSGIKALSKKKTEDSVAPLDTSNAQNDAVTSSKSPVAILKRKFSGSVVAKKSFKNKKKTFKTRKIEPDISIDLHGETQKSSLEKVRVLLENCGKGKCRTALIITGKGLNSEEGGVLRRAVWKRLDHYQEKNNIKFNWAPPYLGGQGAILVSFP